MIELWDIWAEMRSFPPFAYLIAFCFGSIIGSFLNVVIYRLPLDRDVVFPPSACGSCGNPLRAYENIPIFSYWLQGGRCRTCGATYSPRYMLVEAWIAAWAVYLVSFNHGVLNWPWLYQLTLVALATAVFLTDLDHWIIPDQVNAFGVIFGIVGSIWMPARHDLDFLADFGFDWLTGNVASSLLGAIFGYAFFATIQVVGLILAKQEAMGGGDVKYAAALGAFLGWQLSFMAFLLSFLLGALIALPMMLLPGGSGKDPIPFGTFMSVAAVPTLLWGSVWLDRLLFPEL